MKIYLVRHGESLDSDQDATRPLSARGRKDIENLGKFLANSKPHIFHIIHSGILRAKQTACILANALKFSDEIESRVGLQPLDDIMDIKEELKNYSNNILIVGHLPFMPRLLSALMVGNESKTMVSFEPGALVCLENIEDESWTINFVIQPSLLA